MEWWRSDLVPDIPTPVVERAFHVVLPVVLPGRGVVARRFIPIESIRRVVVGFAWMGARPVSSSTTVLQKGQICGDFAKKYEQRTMMRKAQRTGQLRFGWQHLFIWRIAISSTVYQKWVVWICFGLGWYVQYILHNWPILWRIPPQSMNHQSIFAPGRYWMVDDHHSAPVFRIGDVFRTWWESMFGAWWCVKIAFESSRQCKRTRLL